MKLSYILKTTCRLFLLFIAVLLVFFNAGFYYSPDLETPESGNWNKDVYQQLTYLKAEMHTGAAAEMQQLFPEGHLFTNALYGLAWADLAGPGQEKGFPRIRGNETQLAQSEIAYTLMEILSEKGRKIFNADLPLKYGVFYRGWANYLMSKRWEIDPVRPDIPERDMMQFRRDCQEISKAFSESEEPYLESYHDGIWPADNVIAIASLAAYDRYVKNPVYRPLINEWLVKVKSQLDPDTGLIPHVVYKGLPAQGARGCSQSLILSFLPEIDSAFAVEQFDLYQKHFVDQRLGLPGIREYPKGMEGTGDIDSGPVIWGIGGAASVVGQRAAYANGDYKLYKGLRNSIETFGCGFTWFGEKRYLFGQLPMADAFIAWSNSIEQTPVDAPMTVPWVIHLVSLALLLIIGWVGLKL